MADKQRREDNMYNSEATMTLTKNKGENGTKPTLLQAQKIKDFALHYLHCLYQRTVPCATQGFQWGNGRRRDMATLRCSNDVVPGVFKARRCPKIFETMLDVNLETDIVATLRAQGSSRVSINWMFTSQNVYIDTLLEGSPSDPRS
jgi:hypothetical protein